MTKLPQLYVVMLRYRIAAMVALFMLLGAAREGPLHLGTRYLFAAIALASSYVAATALNDLADEEIDKVNHPRDAGRPLVDGSATRRQLLVLHVLASGLALLAALPLGGRGVALLVAALLVSQLYSARPVRLSYRIAGAPPALGVGYVLVPYSLGVVAAGGSLRDDVSLLPCALFLLFAARIMLKDFRDREGDARYGKPTLLLRYGKTATCAMSLSALLAGDVLLSLALEPRIALFVQPFVVAIASMLRALWRSADARGEQVVNRHRREDGQRSSALRARLARRRGARSVRRRGIGPRRCPDRPLLPELRDARSPAGSSHDRLQRLTGPTFAPY